MARKKKTDRSGSTRPARGLGRGLSALMDDVNMDELVSGDIMIVDDIPDVPDPEEDRKTIPRDVPVSSEPDVGPTPDLGMGHGVTFVTPGQLERNPEQPRKHFDRQELSDLSDSIRQKGILQPILVRPLPGRQQGQKSVYQVIAGERRWQAALMAHLDQIPVFIREITDQEALEIGVIENVQRAALNPMEEAMAYDTLVRQFGRSQADVAEAVGKSRPYVANMMRLLRLPEKVRDHLAKGVITTGHARAIIAAPDPEDMAELIVARNLTVRDAEEWVRKLKDEGASQKKTGSRSRSVKGADERRLEAQLMDALGLSVDLRHRGPNGELRIKYKTADQLDDIVKRLVEGG